MEVDIIEIIKKVKKTKNYVATKKGILTSDRSVLTSKQGRTEVGSD